ncbi:MAG: phage tail protein, partial [Anaerotignum sp.]
ADIRDRFETYFEELRKSWADSTSLTVRISHLESRALEAEGVVDIGNCTINGDCGNTVLGADEIPILGEIGVTA